MASPCGPREVHAWLLPESLGSPFSLLTAVSCLREGAEGEPGPGTGEEGKRGNRVHTSAQHSSGGACHLGVQYSSGCGTHQMQHADPAGAAPRACGPLGLRSWTALPYSVKSGIPKGHGILWRAHYPLGKKRHRVNNGAKKRRAEAQGVG